MKKPKLSLLAYTIVGALVGSSVGFGGYFIYKAVQKEEKVFEGYVELGEPKTIWFNSGALNADKSKANKSWDFQIKVYPYQNGDYWLDDDGLKELREAIWKKLYHGQEISTLDNMVFGNVNMIGESSNGLYFPLTKEMFLNIAGWKNHKNLSNKKKIDGIMSTITHEYGHHIANMYLTTSYSTHSWNGDNGNVPTVEKEDGTRELTNWNSEFTEKFYRDLKYDDTTFLYGKGGIREGETGKGNGRVESIARKVNLHDLFWNANSDRSVKYNEGRQVFGIPGVIGRIKNHRSFGKVGSVAWGPNDDWYIKYRYSLDEIVTRQLSQLMHVYDLPDKRDFFDHMIRENGNKQTVNFDSFISDARSMYQVYVSDDPWKKAKFELDPFYKDSVFRNQVVTRNVYNNFRNAMGYHKMISNIYGLNLTHATVDKETGSKFANYNDGELNQHKFKITGWTPKDVKGVFYGDVTGGNPSQGDIDLDLMKFGTEAERKKLWNFDRKDSLFAQDKVDSHPFKNNGGDWLPFSTNKYLESRGRFYSGSEFRWWVDENTDGNATPDEMLSTAAILKKYNDATEEDVINRVLPVSTFRQTWNEGDIFPRLRYLTDIDEGRKKLVIRLY
ncbi:MYPU_1760 family metalloprotease [Mycoplasma todarodis]|uniref:Uncharacterized protein n=1 Tax=Mycoplasma todarodis TaxID=1937191 RepID=A0A4R0XQI5_9MOLU|nr:hypothetical protein [Mycoplasma todarodis]TCG11846.1 hypothetical protein C4B25_00815 [Mycoplasma todarodis]